MDWVVEKIAFVTEALRETTASANAESKSSMGDKYETTQAMLHLEKEKHQTQLTQALGLKKVLDMINPKKANDSVDLGALLETDQGWYYISVGAGKLPIVGTDVISISPVAPLAQQFKFCKLGSQVEFNSRTYRLMAIY